MKEKSEKSVVAGTSHIDRETVIRNLHQVMQWDNSLSRCCAVRGLARLGAKDIESILLFIDALLDPDPDVRADAAEALGRVKAESAVAPLLANIEGDPEGDVRIAAVRAVAEIGSTTAVDGLIRCIRESGYPELDQMVDDADFGACWEVQGGALRALGSIGDASAVQPLMDLLEGEDNEEIQESGFQVLAEFADERAGEFLVGRLKNGNPLTRRRAAQALSTEPNLHGASYALPAEMLNALNDALVDPEPNVRIYAARALSTSNNPMVAVSLTLLLNDPEAEVRNEVASMLGGIRGSAIVDRLHDLLQQAEAESKPLLVHVLGEIADVSSYPLLHDVLRLCDPVNDRHLLYETIVALGAIGEPGPGKDVIEILVNSDMHYTIRVQAARALGHIYRGATTNEYAGEEQLEEGLKAALVSAIDDENARVSYAAISALLEIDKDQAVDRLIALLRVDAAVPGPPESLAAIEPNEGMGGNDIPTAMQHMIGDHSPGTSTLAAILAQPSTAADSHESETELEQDTETHSEKRVLAARLLGNIPNPGPQVMAALAAAGADPDAVVRKEVILTLGRIADPKSVPVILNGLSAPQDDVCMASLDALKNFNSMKKVNKRLAALFDDPNPDMRERIITTLNFDGGPAATACLLQALEDENRNVCRAALARLPADAGSARATRLASDLIFRFAGELKANAVAALRRMNDCSSAVWLLETLHDADREELHWICIDALAEMYAQEGQEAARNSI